MATDSDTRRPGSAPYGSGRSSAQRSAIAAAVEATASRAFSVDDIATAVRSTSPRTGLATVYRALTAMQAAGFIEPVGTRDGATLYARCACEGHHHHVVCTSCGAVGDVDCPVIVTAEGDTKGFEVTGHSLVMHGVCPDCRAGKSTAAGG